MCMWKIGFDIIKKINNKSVLRDLEVKRQCLCHIICSLMSNKTNCPALAMKNTFSFYLEFACALTV